MFKYDNTEKIGNGKVYSIPSIHLSNMDQALQYYFNFFHQTFSRDGLNTRG